MSKKNATKLIIFLLFIIWAIWFLKFDKHNPQIKPITANSNYWGITFSKKFAQQLGLNWREAYLAMLYDLKVKYIRLPIYWDEIEPSQGQFNFSDYDWMLDQGRQQNVKFIVTIGLRVPRWPECHPPTWLKNVNNEEIKRRTMSEIQTIINRYKNNSEIVYWQVENEPLLDSFGICPPSDVDFLKTEVAAVRSLDSRQVLVTASGELSSWQKEALIGDLFGTTMYRVVWGKAWGYWRWPLPVSFYQTKQSLLGLKPNQTIIAELQAEPWAPNSTLDKVKQLETEKSFNLNQFKANAQFALNAEFNQAYLWGAEWWYWQLKQGHNEYWNFAKTLFQQSVNYE